MSKVALPHAQWRESDNHNPRNVHAVKGVHAQHLSMVFINACEASPKMTEVLVCLDKTSRIGTSI